MQYSNGSYKSRPLRGESAKWLSSIWSDAHHRAHYRVSAPIVSGSSSSNGDISNL